MARPIDDALQRATGNVLHIQQPQPSLREQPLIINADDIRMIELRQRLRLLASIVGNFQRHKSAQRTLTGQINAGKRPATQRRQQIKIINPLLDRQIDRRHQRAGDCRRLGHAFAGQHAAQLLRRQRKSRIILFRRNLLPGLPAQMELFVHQIAWRTIGAAQLRKFCEVALQ